MRRYDGFSKATNITRSSMPGVFKRFIADETGATSIEYGLIVAIISVAVIGALQQIALALNGHMNDVNSNL